MMNNIDVKSYSLPQSLIQMLLSAGLIKENPLVQNQPQQFVAHNSDFLNQMNKKFMFHIDTSKGPKYNLTNQGFHFALLDTPSQVHLILLKFIEHI